VVLAEPDADSGQVRLTTRSAAIVRALDLAGGSPRLARAMRLVPGPLRDVVYAVVVRVRYRVFGKKDACRAPPYRRGARPPPPVAHAPLGPRVLAGLGGEDQGPGGQVVLAPAVGADEALVGGPGDAVGVPLGKRALVRWCPAAVVLEPPVRVGDGVLGAGGAVRVHRQSLAGRYRRRGTRARQASPATQAPAATDATTVSHGAAPTPSPGYGLVTGDVTGTAW
jgi:hypothetical protein